MQSVLSNLRTGRSTAIFVISLALIAAASSARGAVFFSPDITAELGTPTPTVVEDDDAASDSGAGAIAIPPYLAATFGAVPASAEPRLIGAR